MKNIRVVVDELKRKWFPTADDKAWQDWVDYKQREWRDLIGLLSSDARESLKRRALYLLFVPSAELNPLYWKEKVGSFYRGPNFLETLTPSLRDYAAELVTGFQAILAPQHHDLSRNVVERHGAITVSMEIPDEHHDALEYYNRCILELLVLLPVEQAEKIFPHYSLQDISTFSNMEDESGYNPFAKLMFAWDVDDRWKRAADTAMRQIVLDEIAGRRQPRVDWENALRCYARTVQSSLYHEQTYMADLFASQTQFIMDNRQSGAILINSWEVGRTLNALAGPAHQELRHRIARMVVLEGDENSRMKAYSDESRQTARGLLAEFGGSDAELGDQLKVLIAEGEEDAAKAATQRVQSQLRENEVLAQMR